MFWIKRLDSVLVIALVVARLGSVLEAHLHVKISTIKAPSKHNVLIEFWCSV